MRHKSSVPYLRLLQTCWHYAGPGRGLMIVFYLMTIGANLTSIWQPFVIGKLINRLQQGGGDLLHDAIFWLAVYVLLTLGFWLLHGPSRLIERNIAFNVRNNFQKHYYNLITHLPMHWHQEHHTGNTVNRISKASQGLYNFADEQFIYIENIVTAISAFAMLAFIAHSIALIEIVFAIAIITLLIRYDRVLIPIIHTRNEREHQYSSLFFDFASNIVSVISFNLAGYTQVKLNNALQHIAEPLKREIVINELKWFTMMMLIVIAEFTIMVLYIYKILSTGNSLMLGSLVAIYQYMHNLNRLFFNLASNYSRLLQQTTDLESGEPLVKAFDSLAMKDEGKPSLAVTQGEIAFDHINFTYPNGRHVFNNLHLTIKPTEKVGIVGRSGAGKTTLIHLLLRFHETSGNGIWIDKQNINQVSYASLRESVAVIPQDTSLFETTLMENIRCGRLDATDEEVIAAAKKAHADEFITQLPEAYQALVGERGIKLSGGQRQRIAIARAILKNAPILVLDEATSALDSESEKRIQESFSELMREKTVIAIAHRLSTIAHLDRLVVMDSGQIVEEGTHAELLAKNGYYAKLWAMQSGGFLPN
ncbi:MAG TPA: ABC transporter ATP-binding protein [Rickettsiales bacterium]|nr:ABC transporter ATP-binding protein [Rickettsiales bacterium]